MHASETPVDDSWMRAFAERFRHLPPDAAVRVAGACWDKLSILEQAAITLDWDSWSRSKQRAPQGEWKSWGFLTGRGFGKTLAASKFINAEVEAGRAKLIGLAAQDEANSIAIQVNGPTGLIQTAHPKRRPKFEASRLELVWPNGARAYVRTPEVPGKIRGLEYHLSWISEIQSWPPSTREEAFHNFALSTRLGYARTVWDATAKRRHPLLKELIAQHEANPSTHIIVRGTTHENAANLGKGYVAEMERKFGGTARGREELLGEMLSDAEFSLVKQEWIDVARRNLPSRLTRRIIGIDPAITAGRGSDTTGIVEVGLGTDGQAYVIGDATGKYEPSKWASIALDWYTRHDCDLVVAETNKAGQLVTQNLRAAASERGLEVVVVGKDEHPQTKPGTVHVKEVFARGSKDTRAEPLATAYERRRVSHVIGADLNSLEDTLTTWEPPVSNAARVGSPGDLDALVHAIVEILDLSHAPAPDPAEGFIGIQETAKKLFAPQPMASLAHAFSSSFVGRGDRI